jgi:hypothetical protein
VDMEEESGVFGDLDAMAPQTIPSLETFVRIGEDVEGGIIEDINIVVSPYTEHFDYGEFLFYGNSDSMMTINLPWFQLQQLLELQGACHKIVPKELLTQILRTCSKNQ